MATDTERREVARRLRDWTWKSASPECLLNQLAFGDDCPGIDDNPDTIGCHECEVMAAKRLADLIEPSDRNDKLCAHCDYCDYCDLPKCSEQDGYSFKPKGYVDLMVLADNTIRSARRDMEICGDTVPTWYAAGRLEAVARSIREILGVES